jgi:hypothetical protein
MIMRFLQLSIFCGVFLLMLSGKALAETPFPTIHLPKGTADCPIPKNDRVRNHMKYLLHHRDLTVHEGIRTKQYSLANCIDCHVQPGPDGKIAAHSSKDHFCNGCHQYAAVHIDCFECHADRPQKYIKRGNKTEASNEKMQDELAKNSDAGNGSDK